MTSALQTGIVQLRDVTEAIKVRIRNPQKLRNLELFLLAIAWTIAGGALLMVQLGALGTVDWWLLYLFGGLAAETLALHIAMRFVAREADPLILPIATVLNGLGIAMIYRLDIAEGFVGWESQGVRQIVWTGIALLAAFAVLVLVRNHRILARYRYTAMAAAIVLLLLPMTPLGATINGARVWISLAGFSFQPGEIAKIALAIFFAGYFVTARDSLSIVGTRFLGMTFPRLRDLGPIMVVWGVCMLILVVQGDLGTGLLYFGLFTVMLYVATGKRSWILIGFALIIVGAATLWILSQAQIPALQDLGIGRAERRVNVWLNAFDEEVFQAQGGSYQVVQGIFGMAAGGLVGTGLGLGRPDIVPYANSDFIIASLGEELGLVGIFAILALYLIFVSRGIRIGYLGPDDFTKLLAVGLAFVIGLQVFIVVGGVTRVIPLTGLTTPFLAAGGSSLLANWIIAALLLRLSDSVRMQQRVVVS